MKKNILYTLFALSSNISATKNHFLKKNKESTIINKSQSPQTICRFAKIVENNFKINLKTKKFKSIEAFYSKKHQAISVTFFAKKNKNHRTFVL